ncbi:MAG: hypothetical protein ACE14M_05150 [Terriglobales bacterium]
MRTFLFDMNTARKGRRLEHEIRQIFRDAGYSVMRGASSKGELCGCAVDLIATRLTKDTDYTVYVVGLQCKAKKRNNS